MRYHISGTTMGAPIEVDIEAASAQDAHEKASKAGIDVRRVTHVDTAKQEEKVHSDVAEVVAVRGEIGDPRCGGCGYPLSGLGGGSDITCPECGARADFDAWLDSLRSEPQEARGSTQSFVLKRGEVLVRLTPIGAIELAITIAFGIMLAKVLWWLLVVVILGLAMS